jgi:hypothetical protein
VLSIQIQFTFLEATLGLSYLNYKAF